jgi:predicted metal-binding membrane protein
VAREKNVASIGIASHIVARDAWRYGLRLALRCGRGCAAFMAILLLVGAMDLRAMGVVTLAITIERLAPGTVAAARAIGVATAGTGLFLIARCVGTGVGI